ncbi:DUF4136 domain-containing protein [Marinigracilibium pacificum]|uniref:DUF4136 domain-containing protein n=1 Tax=Marinigracilibium pacificum TaxID=2729599 RepID=A0A848J1S0_9BACT|nr:DUF4136 domain-containing protein [Marinigracilibium pacificum]NMM48259.1 DUF4136 domain-containing protein [Marinigracilibium pacificum]
MKNIFYFLLIFLMGCSSANIVESWKDPDTTISETEYQKVMIAVLASNEGRRRTAEDFLAQKYPKLVPSYNVFKGLDEKNIDKEQLKSILTNQGFDAVIIMRLVDVSKETNYVPGNYSGGFYGYYGAYWPGYYNPGYYTEDTKYSVSTDVFDLNRNKLVWSAITSSYNSSKIETAVEDIAYSITKEMKKTGFLQ